MPLPIRIPILSLDSWSMRDTKVRSSRATSATLDAWSLHRRGTPPATMYNDEPIVSTCGQSGRLGNQYIEGILPKGPYPPCVSMAGRALLAGYTRYISNEYWHRWLYVGTFLRNKHHLQAQNGSRCSSRDVLLHLASPQMIVRDISFYLQPQEKLFGVHKV